MAKSYVHKGEDELRFMDDVAYAAHVIRRAVVRITNETSAVISDRHRAAMQRDERVSVRFTEDEIADLIRERLDKTLRIS